MEDAHFETAFKRLIEIEGFKSDRRTDPGGYTVWGISSRKWPEMFRSGDPTLDQAKMFYLREFWKHNKCHLLPEYAVKWELFESSVNCGAVNGARFLQLAYNIIRRPSWPAIGVDGVVGELETLPAIRRACPRYTRSLVKAQNIVQGNYYMALGDLENIRGWIDKRVEFEAAV